MRNAIFVLIICANCEGLCKEFFLKTDLFKEWLKKFVELLTKEKGKTATNEWENHDSDILQALHSIYKKIRTTLFPYLPVN